MPNFLSNVHQLALLVTGGLLTIVWLYIVARVVTRAVIRTIEEKKNNG